MPQSTLLFADPAGAPMVESGELGEILIVQGTYSQDWLLYDTDWNWRLLSAEGGLSRCPADIGSHWFDGVEHVTGKRITAVCTARDISQHQAAPPGCHCYIRRENGSARRL